MDGHRRRIVIVGGGFAGLTTAQQLAKAEVEVTLIDRTNHHLFQPLLYQVATGGLSPADIATPIRYVLRRQHNVRVLLQSVTDVFADHVMTEEGPIPFDVLVVATGATHHYFGHDDWERYAPGLKTLPDAIRIRATILAAFEEAERTGDLEGNLTFVVIGGGPTGVEMAGAIAEMAHYTLRKDFRTIDPAEARVLLVEAAPQVLSHYRDPLPAKAAAQLERLGVDLRIGWTVTALDENTVTLTDGHLTDTIPASAKVWAAGVTANPLGQSLSSLGAELDRAGRVIVDADLTVPGHPNIFVIGDLAAVTHQEHLVPGVAPAAMQMGRYVAGLIRNESAERSPFRYRDKGSLATIGRSAGVADLWGGRFSGWPAWVAWLTIHIFFLIGFQNRLLVLLQWTWNYLTHNRSARLIVDYSPDPD